MDSISKEQYEFAQARIEELLPLVNDNTPANDRNAVELTMMSDIVIAYEKKHYPIGKPTVAELIGLSIEEKGITQKQLASELGVSPSRVNDYISGKFLQEALSTTSYQRSRATRESSFPLIS